MLAARSVTVKIRFGDYETITRSSTLDDATARTDLLWRDAAALFDRWCATAFQPVRLIGMAAVFTLTAIRHTRVLYRAEPIPSK